MRSYSIGVFGKATALVSFHTTPSAGPERPVPKRKSDAVDV